MASIRKTAAEEDEDYKNVLGLIENEDYLNWPNEAGVSFGDFFPSLFLNNNNPSSV